MDNTEQATKSNQRDSGYYYRQLPTGIQDSLSTEQAREIQKVIARAIRVPSKKLVSLELTFWFFKRFYMVLYLGEDKRKLLRFTDNHSGKILKLSVHIFTTLMVWAATLFVALAVVYYAKSTLGIDLVPGQHAEEVIIKSL